MKIRLTAALAMALASPAFANTPDTVPADPEPITMIEQNSFIALSDDAGADITMIFGDVDGYGQLPQDNEQLEKLIEAPAPDAE